MLQAGVRILDGLNYDRAELITRVLTGGNNMPSFAGHLSTGDLNDLVDFLQALR